MLAEGIGLLPGLRRISVGPFAQQVGALSTRQNGRSRSRASLP